MIKMNITAADFAALENEIVVESTAITIGRMAGLISASGNSAEAREIVTGFYKAVANQDDASKLRLAFFEAAEAAEREQLSK